MKLLLISMPWQSLDCPSLALGILRERVKHCKTPPDVSELYAGLRWAEFLVETTGGRIQAADYTHVAEEGIFHGLGDWIFTPALYGVREWKRAEYERYLADLGLELGPALEMHQLSADFVERLADEVVALGCDVVGFTSTFMQNVPSLALARALKRRRPQLRTVMGGANCDGPQGIALHRNFEFLDFVIRGEGEQAFVELLDALDGHGESADIAGLCWRSAQGPVANPERTHAFPAQQIPAPNYDSYFTALEASPLQADLTPKLVLEGARGCWWGQKHHCTFCGLNGSMMTFRSKPPAQLLDEMRQALERYKTLDVVMVDNIIDLRYFKELLPRIAAADWDLRIHFEVKSNLTSEQIEALRAAGVMHVQPGIENLSSRVLKLMDKGVAGCHNVRVLRDCEAAGLTVSWNYLYGFPGEQPEDYESLIEQMPALVHLQPPSGATRIALERFSPNFERPSLGFSWRRPAAFYSYVYELPESELMNLVYLFATNDAGLQGEAEERLRRAISEWRRLHFRSELTWRQVEERIFIQDARANRPPAEYVLEEPLDVALYLALQRPQSFDGLQQRLEKEGLMATEEELRARLATWRQQGLLFEEGGHVLALATRAGPRRVRIPSNPEEEQIDDDHRQRSLPVSAAAAE